MELCVVRPEGRGGPAAAGTAEKMGSAATRGEGGERRARRREKWQSRRRARERARAGRGREVLDERRQTGDGGRRAEDGRRSTVDGRRWADEDDDDLAERQRLHVHASRLQPGGGDGTWTGVQPSGPLEPTAHPLTTQLQPLRSYCCRSAATPRRPPAAQRSADAERAQAARPARAAQFRPANSNNSAPTPPSVSGRAL